SATMNLNGEYDFTAAGTDSSINIFLGDQVNLNGETTYTVGDNGSISVASYYSVLNNNAVQTFNTGTDSDVLLGGSSAGGYGALNVNTSNVYNLGTNSTMTFASSGSIDFAAGTTQDVPGGMVLQFYGGETLSSPDKNLVLGSGATLQANTIAVNWNSVLGGNFTMDSDGGTMNADQNIVFDFFCYYQPTTTTFNFEGTSTISVTGDDGLIQVGAWCCSNASMNFNGEYDFATAGNNSSINIFLGDQVNLNGENSFTVGDNGDISVGSLYTTTTVSASQAFYAGANSEVTLTAGQTVNLNASNTFDTGAGSTVDVVTGCTNGAINVASGTTQAATGADSFEFTTYTLTLNNGSLISSTGDITLAQHELVNNGGTVTTTGVSTAITVLNCCTADLIL
ncbi:MAG: hypothetical protein K2Z81_14990, partial [Cyanobacteria bacterium]|nr:hypothetical protein [Cyanobacteriota bacterium]